MPRHRLSPTSPSRPGRRRRWAAFLGAAAALGVVTAVVVAPASAQRAADDGVHRASCWTDRAGYCSVRHALGSTPAAIKVSPRSQRYKLSVVAGSITAERFRVLAQRPDGRAYANRFIRFEYSATGTTTPTTTTTTTTTKPTTTTTAPTTTTPPPTTPPPTTPPDAKPVCGTTALNGPSAAPAGAVTVPAGNNASVDFAKAGATYWFAPGVHTLGTGQYDQIIPADGSTFVGAPGAVLDGQSTNAYAFTQHAKNVTIKYLTIRGFVSPRDQGVVNHDSGDGWTIAHNTMTQNKGAAMMSGSGQKMIGNCLKGNGQYGLNAYQAGNGPENILLEGNEFVGNNTDDWESKVDGCGCTGAMKFWSVDGADIRGNWIHHNHGPGIWADTNDNDFLIENNLIEANDDQAIFYEISYNAIIRNNVIRNNTWQLGREFANRDEGFPIGTIYISEAGGDARVPARTSSLEIYGNKFENNWGGIAAWENSDRFCGVNTTADCTLIVGESSTGKCTQPGIASEPLYSDCRWKTRKLDIHHNQFVFDPAKVDGGCPTTYCGQSALFANYGTYPSWSPYKGRAIQEAITYKQSNRWHDNSYTGPWRFVAYETSRLLTLAQWQAAPFGQDAGSS